VGLIGADQKHEPCIRTKIDISRRKEKGKEGKSRKAKGRRKRVERGGEDTNFNTKLKIWRKVR
jgi:hypothetical protein